MTTVKSLHIVYADWCPHRVPTTVEPIKKKAEQIGVSCILYHVDDPSASKKADELVKKYGDWSEECLIRQIFLEFYDASEPFKGCHLIGTVTMRPMRGDFSFVRPCTS